MLWHQIDHLGTQLQQQQAAGHPLLLQAPPLLEVTVPPQAPLHYYNWSVPQPNDSLVEVMDILNRSGDIKAVTVCPQGALSEQCSVL